MHITHLDLFSGIGGFTLGFSRVKGTPIKTIAFCEIEPYAREVLARHYPHIPIETDVLTLNGKQYPSDIITAGFPCQDLSVAGKKQGLQGSRSGLFYETLRIADEAQATTILYENSPELIRRDEYREAFIESLQERGYSVIWRICSAREFGYLHQRERTYALCIKQEAITDPNRLRQLCIEKIQHYHTDEITQRPPKEIISLYTRFTERERQGDYRLDCRDIRNDDGLSTRLQQIHALGNTIIPNIATAWGELIGELYTTKLITSKSVKPQKPRDFTPFICGQGRATLAQKI